MIYLDNAATTYRKPESVYRAMDETNRRLAVNAGRGSYRLAREAGELLEETKELLREEAGAPAWARVIFTPSATIAFNEIIGGIHWKREDTAYVSPYEHNAVVRTLYGYRRKVGFSVQELPLNADTLEIDLQKAEYCFSIKRPSCVFLSCVSNVTGYVLPVKELCNLAKKYDSLVILDGAQALGSIPFTLAEAEADYFVFAGHKALHGPFGIGGFISLSGIPLEPALYGGTGTDSLNPEMPQGTLGLEPGSPNIVAAAGLRAALQELREPEKRGACQKREKELTERLIAGLREIDGAVLCGIREGERQAGIISMNLKGYLSQETGALLDMDYDISVRTGYHCAPLIHKYLQDQEYGGTVRISPDWYTTEEEADRMLQALSELSE